MVARIGDIYAVEIEPGQVKLFHHVMDDATQLGSNVIRAFLPSYSAGSLPDPAAVIQADVEFHAHTLCALGMKLGLWHKVGHIQPVDKVVTWFRDSNDYGNPDIKVSRDWSVWKVNQAREHIGPLRGEFLGAEIGVVFSPAAIVLRMTTGSSGNFYPAHE